MYDHAIINPDPDNDWTWAEETIVGLPAIVRVLLTLQRSGINRVTLPPEVAHLKSMIRCWNDKKRLPLLVWDDPQESHSRSTGSPSLWIQGGVLFDSSLIPWFLGKKEATPHALACVMQNGEPPFLVFNGDGMKATEAGFSSDRTVDTAYKSVKEISVPTGMYCQRISDLIPPGKDRGMLKMIGKPDEAMHVNWFRILTFPAIRFFSQLGITPNQLTWTGFIIGLLGAAIITAGTYWGGVLGAMLLCISWIFDNMDGTLARMTFSESTRGEKLDSTLGHLINLAFFTALVWSVYGKASFLMAGFFSILMIGSITFAYCICGLEKRCRETTGKNGPSKQLRVILDRINGRDFTVLVLIFAILDGFQFFLWGSLAGLQVFSMLHLWLLYKNRHRRMISSSR